MTFSGGSYGEIERWLWNFATSHAKRVDPRIQVIVEAGDERQGASYGVRLRLGGRTTATVEFDYEELAANRGSLAWCAALADRIQQIVRSELMLTAPASPR